MADGQIQRHGVIGLDVGTTAVKVGLYSPDGTEHAVVSRDYPLNSPHPGWAEQDPDVIVEACLDALGEIGRLAQRAGITIAGIAASTAMHSLIGFDDLGRPLTPMLTYADTRSRAQADRLRSEHLGVYRRTGTPLHPMAPLAKLVWFHDEQPELAGRVRTWAGIKEYLIHALTGAWAIDHASASATGLFNLENREWDSEALQLAHIGSDRLAPLVPTTHVAGGLTSDTAERTGLASDTPVVIGATDGVLANLGVGALGNDVGAITIGTSGAVRVTVDAPVTDPAMRVFCYALTDQRWVVGGAINNGGLWLRWLRETVFGAALEDDELTALAQDIPPGADGLLSLPYLTGERAPQWSAAPSGVIFGLRFHHGRGHLVRAGLEGVAHQLRLVTDALADCGHPVRTLRATGGFTNSALWTQLVADILDVELELPQVTEATAFGAGVLGMTALGLLESIEAINHLIVVRDRIEPQPQNRTVYDEAHRRYDDLARLLAPSFEELAASRDESAAGAS